MKSIFLLMPVFLSILEGRQQDLTENYFQDDIKSQAFNVVKTKCNSCHATKKRTDIFTAENMDSLAADIWKQVFVKKKMPKGKKVNLLKRSQKHCVIGLILPYHHKIKKARCKPGLFNYKLFTILFCYIHRSCLTYYSNFHLARIGHICLNFLRYLKR